MSEEDVRSLRYRLSQAAELLRWWDATNPPDDRGTKLAEQTREWLAGRSVDVPRLHEAPR